MTLLDKIEFLMNQSSLNKRQLSMKSSIPGSTIENWWKKGVDGMRLSTFRTLCDFFGVTMDSMARDDQDIVYKKDVAPVEYSPEERKLIENYRYLGGDGRKRVAYTIDQERSIDREEKKNLLQRSRCIW